MSQDNTGKRRKRRGGRTRAEVKQARANGEPGPKPRGETEITKAIRPASEYQQHLPDTTGKYTEDQRKNIILDYCEMIADGLTGVEASEKIGIRRTTIHRWINAASDAGDTYARAREGQAEYFFHMLLGLVRDLMNNEVDIDPQRARVAVDTLKWAIARCGPRYYGDRQEVNVSGTIEHQAIVRVPERVALPSLEGSSDDGEIIDVEAVPARIEVKDDSQSDA